MFEYLLMQVYKNTVQPSGGKSPKKHSVGVYFWQHGTFWVPN